MADTLQQRAARQAANLRLQHRYQLTGPVRNRDELFKKLLEDLKNPGAGFRYDTNLPYNCLSNIGKMDVICGNCNAKRWPKESDKMCCSKEQKWQRYPYLNEPLEPLKSLFEGVTYDSKQFLNNILKYNSCFQMTSFGADNIVSNREGLNWSNFKVQGQVYHRIGSLLPMTNLNEVFLQIYFI